jgi:hypothetical protein
MPLIMPPSCMLICTWGIPVCKRGFKYAYGHPHFQMGKRRMLYLRLQIGIAVCILQGSPYAYGDSFLKEGDHRISYGDPHLNMWDESNVVSPYTYGDRCMHMGISICIRVFCQCLYAYGGWDDSNITNLHICIW